MSFLIYPTIREAPFLSLVGMGGGGTGLTQAGVSGVAQDYESMTTTSTSFSSSYPLANLWDGNINNVMENTGNSGTNYVTISFTSGLFPSVSTLRVYGLLNSNQYDDRSVSVNGGSYYTPNVYGSTQWWDLVANTDFSAGSALNEIKFRANPNSGGQNPSVSMRAVEVNGDILVQGEIR
tara:strand:- start:130 stop:666 length:537 start_codon:yes stop_codon:yes gene_type:complete